MSGNGILIKKYKDLFDFDLLKNDNILICV